MYSHHFSWYSQLLRLHRPCSTEDPPTNQMSQVIHCQLQYRGSVGIHLIQKRLSSELLYTQTAKHHGCNEFVHCCMPRPQSIVFHIASMATTRMSLSHSRYLQCYLKFVTSMMLCGLGMQQYTMHNATIQKTTFFELGVYTLHSC